LEAAAAGAVAGSEKEAWVMSNDMFMKLDGVKGESADDKHKGEIDVLTWTWGSSQPGAAQVGGGTGRGKAVVQDLVFTKVNDCATPVLLGMHLSGAPIKTAVLTMRKAGKTPLEYTKITMTNCIVTSVNHGGTPEGEGHTETVTLMFSTVKYEYTPQNPDGSGGAVVTTAFDIAANKPL
jgi:type VI secretion system secreted protein Hcp